PLVGGEELLVRRFPVRLELLPLGIVGCGWRGIPAGPGRRLPILVWHDEPRGSNASAIAEGRDTRGTTSASRRSYPVRKVESVSDDVRRKLGPAWPRATRRYPRGP